MNPEFEFNRQVAINKEALKQGITLEDKLKQVIKVGEGEQNPNMRLDDPYIVIGALGVRNGSMCIFGTFQTVEEALDFRTILRVREDQLVTDGQTERMAVFACNRKGFLLID